METMDLKDRALSICTSLIYQLRGVQFISNCLVKLVKLPAFSPFNGCVLVLAVNFENNFYLLLFVTKISVMKILCLFFYDCDDFSDYYQFHFL